MQQVHTEHSLPVKALFSVPGVISQSAEDTQSQSLSKSAVPQSEVPWDKHIGLLGAPLEEGEVHCEIGLCRDTEHSRGTEWLVVGSQ